MKKVEALNLPELELRVRRETCGTNFMDLHFAVRHKVLTEIRFLVEGGSDPNIRDEESLTPLMICCLENDEDWAVGVARMLLQTGAKVGRADKNGRNALMFSSLFKRRVLTALLLKAVDFDLDTVDNAGNTALHYAVFGGDAYIIRELLGATKRQMVSHRSRNKLGHTAMSLAKQMKKMEIVELFRSPEVAGANYEKDFVAQIPKKLLHRPWDDEMQVIEHPDLLRKSLTREILESARIHRARPLNTQLFCRVRPTTMVATKANVKAKRNNVKRAKTFVPTSDSKCETNGNSWRMFVPEYLLILKEQESVSYRPTARSVSQSYDEIFSAVTIEDKVLSESEDSCTDKKSPPCNAGALGGRRKSTFKYPPADLAQVGGRSRSNSDMYESFALQLPGDGKRRNRRQSLQQLSNQALLERRKTLARLSSERLSAKIIEEKVRKPRKISS